MNYSMKIDDQNLICSLILNKTIAYIFYILNHKTNELKKIIHIFKEMQLFLIGLNKSSYADHYYAIAANFFIYYAKSKMHLGSA